MGVWKRRTSSGEETERAGLSARLDAPHGASEPTTPEGRETVATIGKSITIRGDVSGEEDLIIEGRVEGKVELMSHHLTVGPNGQVEAEIAAKAVTIIGRVSGNVTVTERAEIHKSGHVAGDLVTPRLVVQEGAELTGSISMKGSGKSAAVKPVRPLESARPSEQAS
jgi:cytoskeletal protein CcmA (bactofilin family)